MILEKMRKIWKVDIDDNDDEIWTTDNGQWLSWTKTLTFAAQGLSPFWVQRVWYHIYGSYTSDPKRAKPLCFAAEKFD